MRYVIVAVRDSAADGFNRPFFAPSRALAQRSFADEVNRSGSEMNAHPEDYSLVYLGEWDDGDGKFETVPAVLIVRASDVVKSV